MTFEHETIVKVLLLLCMAIVILIVLWNVAYDVYAYFKSYRKGHVTLTPIIPFPQDKLQVFKGTDRLKNVVPDAKVQVEDRRASFCYFYRPPRSLVMVGVNEFMASTFKLHSRLPHEYEEVRSETSERHYRLKPKISVPNNARTISIKMNGFEHGQMCHDFVPIGGAAPGSHYTYQMYGANRIQVTRYVVDGKSEIAGFCIYIEDVGLSKMEYRWTLLNHMARSAKTSTMPGTARSVGITAERREIERNQPKIAVIPEENTNLISSDSEENDQDWTIKYCSKLQRKVMSGKDSSDVVVHQEWIDSIQQMRIKKCEECTKEGLEKEEQPPSYSSIFVV